ncbi:uncharacterized protein LOC114351830 [Ostrinia furnacalis]|uniref:uncharacterized protein LOC114351830 n=1 Tax=Ostrinia furnacalis TaxID=93504 RepID=UPI00103ED4B4|nr:uncharacterized protein LOC114351830 [Ostrinia furnacalis]
MLASSDRRDVTARRPIACPSARGGGASAARASRAPPPARPRVPADGPTPLALSTSECVFLNWSAREKPRRPPEYRTFNVGRQPSLDGDGGVTLLPMGPVNREEDKSNFTGG